MEGRSGSISISFPNDARLAITRQLANWECWFTWGREEGKHRASWFAHETRQDHIHRQTEASCTQRWRWFVIHHLACYYVASEKLRREVVWSVQGIWNYWRSPFASIIAPNSFPCKSNFQPSNGQNFFQLLVVSFWFKTTGLHILYNCYILSRVPTNLDTFY